MAAQTQIEVPRNGNYFETWALLSGDGSPIDLTGHTLSMDCRRIAGAGSVIASAEIDIYDPPNGRFTINWDGADFDAVDGVTEVVRLAFDLLHTFPDSIKRVEVRGHLLVMPEVTE